MEQVGEKQTSFFWIGVGKTKAMHVVDHPKRDGLGKSRPSFLHGREQSAKPRRIRKCGVSACCEVLEAAQMFERFFVGVEESVLLRPQEMFLQESERSACVIGMLHTFSHRQIEMCATIHRDRDVVRHHPPIDRDVVRHHPPLDWDVACVQPLRDRGGVHHQPLWVRRSRRG